MLSRSSTGQGMDAGVMMAEIMMVMMLVAVVAAAEAMMVMTEY